MCRTAATLISNCIHLSAWKNYKIHSSVPVPTTRVIEVEGGRKARARRQADVRAFIRGGRESRNGIFSIRRIPRSDGRCGRRTEVETIGSGSPVRTRFDHGESTRCQRFYTGENRLVAQLTPKNREFAAMMSRWDPWRHVAIHSSKKLGSPTRKRNISCGVSMNRLKADVLVFATICPGQDLDEFLRKSKIF